MNPAQNSLFRLLKPEESGVHFENKLTHSEQFNTYTYKNFYSGAGVGIGDFDNDGLADIVFAGNMVDNSIYRNLGNLKFQDVTQKSGIASEGSWTTGVSLADINGDGLLDIYLCKSGPPGGKRRANELYINKGNFTFIEEAGTYGLAFEGLSTHAAFFDFDNDGDLDCYLLNNSLRSVGAYDLRRDQRKIADEQGGNKFLVNEAGHFLDKTTSSGIYSSAIGFGLGVAVADINRDGWMDIYVSNDFFERDYLYINKKDGSFSEQIEASMPELSLGSMGADIADLNNDALPEVFVTEMLPEHDARRKTTTQFESWDKYSSSNANGYHRQFGRNTLQRNNGDNSFSEVGRFAGVAATDWSWGSLIFDMDNDGLKDIFVANGIFKDLLDQDYINFSATPYMVQRIQQRVPGILLELIDSIPSQPISNYAFKNVGELQFENKAGDWGLDQLTFSNGSAYADLDNDGDLDLVINNLNMPSMIYENRSRQKLPRNATLSVKLRGEGANKFALGSKVELKSGGKEFYQEVSPMRGFMSTVDTRLSFGVGDVQSIDSVVVTWPSGKTTLLEQVKVNQLLELFEGDAITSHKSQVKDKPGTQLVFTRDSLPGVEFIHQENEFVDFDHDRLLFNMISNEGPCVCVGDVNDDGMQDFYVGGARGQSGALYVQSRSGRYSKRNAELFDQDKSSEDTDCVFFDANGDGLTDLYVASGGTEFTLGSTALIDRLYLNRGNGKLERSIESVPSSRTFEVTSTVEQCDFDHDGDVDLFVGSRLVPGRYGYPANGHILINDGKGKMEDATSTIAPGLLKLGLITDAKWGDLDNDGDLDLVIVGEWMPVTIFANDKGKLTNATSSFGLDSTNGWYHAVALSDLNNDGFVDIVTGNHGQNSFFKSSRKEPLMMYVSDFDQNGSDEQIITHYDNGEPYPMHQKSDLVAQLPYLKKNILNFRSYRNKSMKDLFNESVLQSALLLRSYDLKSAAWINTRGKTFERLDLPSEAQYFPVYALLIDDFTNDGVQDILMGGNLYRAKPETGIYGAGYGLLLTGDGAGGFRPTRPGISGLSITGEIRSLARITDGHRNKILLGMNNKSISVLRYEKRKQ